MSIDNSFLLIMEQLIESFKYGIVPTLIVLTYLIVTKVLDNKKERELAKKSIKVNAEILDCFNNLNAFLKHITKDILDKEDDRTNSAIRSSFKSMGYTLLKFATFTIISNNVIKNRENIIDNIENTVNAEFANVYNELVLYDDLIDAVQDKWKDEITADLKNIILDEKLQKEDKIYNIHNKMNLRINNYISSVNNKFLAKQ